ncbi:hypothetical protein AM501_09970 [Aneurinibacillus migulanus]|uniref:hypothetical protein n=1 Tax=Aneurinibacillus migulanus TaxID=47500 RepID=UPI0005BCE0B9|nr:hypothetical protein [Aneurinibacillus migulanus]KIV56470.1 hypothetical protein TS64_09385 [Aneurinibacillus migulanus]KPD08478.1 hypothetical protein AM501_09970 [Aneurinibacillus migulanus]
MSKHIFQPPSSTWKWVLYPLAIASILFSLWIFFVFTQSIQKTLFLKIEMILGYFSIFSSIYLLVSYRYLCWAADAKQTVANLLLSHPNLIFCDNDELYQFNEDQLTRAGYTKEEFIALNQEDIQEVIQYNLSMKEH